MGDDFPTKGRPSCGPRADPPWASAPVGVPLPIAVTQPKPASSKVESQPVPKKRSWLGRLVIVLLLSLGVRWFYEYATLPDPRGLIDQTPETTALIRTRDEAARSQGKKPRHRQDWVSLGSIAPLAVDSVIASEDASFFIHHGIDFDEVRKALDQAWEKGSLGRGASTITQQLAKNLWRPQFVAEGERIDPRAAPGKCTAEEANSRAVSERRRMGRWRLRYRSRLAGAFRDLRQPTVGGAGCGPRGDAPVPAPLDSREALPRLA